MPSINWEEAKPFVYAGIAAVVIIGIIVIIVMALNKKRPVPTPMQLLVRNIRASAVPVPARSIWITGNAHMPETCMGALVGTLYTSHVVAHLIRPSWARAGFAMLWRREVLLTSPSDIEDLRGGACLVRGTGVMRYVDDLYWLHPDMQDAATVKRWRAIVGGAGDTSELLTGVQAYYRDGMESLLAVQEEIAALDLNAQTVRAIQFGERQVHIRDVQKRNDEDDNDKDDKPEEEVAA